MNLSGLATKKHIHFIGIGGSKVAYVALFCHLVLKKKVTGSNLVNTFYTQQLSKKHGIEVAVGPHRENALGATVDLVVRSLAVPDDNIELKCARERAILVLTAPQIVGMITRTIPTIAITGSHGKGTTASLLALLLKKVNKLALLLLGMPLREIDNSNFYWNQKVTHGWCVLEANELPSDFLEYSPEHVIITNIDYEHPDHFENLDTELSVFAQFFATIKRGGVIVANTENGNVAKLMNLTETKSIIQKNNLSLIPYTFNEAELELIEKNRFFKGARFLEDYKVVWRFARHLGIEEKDIVTIFREYQGASRHFEIKVSNSRGFVLVDDYAHNPQKIEATIQHARLIYPGKRVCVIFEPHQFERTLALRNELVHSLSHADEVALLPIYGVAGRERSSIIHQISSEHLRNDLVAQKVPCILLHNYSETIKYIVGRITEEVIVITMGAGSIDTLYENLELSTLRK